MNRKLLSDAIIAKRKRDGVSLRQAAKDADILSHSVIARIERMESDPDSDTLAKIAAWLGRPVTDFLPNAKTEGQVSYYPDTDTPTFVEAHLLKDNTLTPEAARALSEIFRTAYNQFSGFSKTQKGTR